MRYETAAIRRQDRLLDEAHAWELLLAGEYGVLSMSTEQGGYGVPVNYAVAEDIIYIHCAPQGRKLQAIASDGRVSFCVVGHKRIVPEEFTTEFESVIVTGQAHIVKDDAQRTKALQLIVEKYSPDHIDEGLRAIERSLHRTTIIAIRIETYSGKKKEIA